MSLIRKPTTLTILLAGAVAAAALLIASTATRSAQAGSSFTARPSPAWTLKNLEGEAVKSADFEGKVVILDFWATWCPPCRAEIPSFIELQKEYGEKGLAIVGASLDKKGPDVVKKFAKKMNINYSLVMADQKTLDAFGGVEVIPTTFIIDRKGQIVQRHVGLTSKAEFEKEIKPLLGK